MNDTNKTNRTHHKKLITRSRQQSCNKHNTGFVSNPELLVLCDIMMKCFQHSYRIHSLITHYNLIDFSQTLPPVQFMYLYCTLQAREMCEMCLNVYIKHVEHLCNQNIKTNMESRVWIFDSMQTSEKFFILQCCAVSKNQYLLVTPQYRSCSSSTNGKW